MGKYFKIVLLIIAWMAMIGLIGPELVSAKSDLLVIVGISVIVFGIIPATYFVINSMKSKEE
ncbi:MAG: hypothetical protein ACRDD9_23605 [Shewanella sp.]